MTDLELKPILETEAAPPIHAPPPVTYKTKTQRLIDQLNEQISQRESMVKWLSSRQTVLEELAVPMSLCNEKVDFDNLSHDDVIKVIKAFPGAKWTKTPSSLGGKVDYTTQIEGVSLRCYSGEPPPNCRIVEEEMHVPAIPSRVEIIRKLVCSKGALTPA